MKSDEWSQAKDVGSSVWEAVKRGSDSLAQAAKRLAQLQRLQAQIQKLRARRRSTLYAIGEQVYALHGRGKVRNRDVLENCKTIDLIARQITDMQQQIEALREQARHACTAAEPVDDSFLTDDEDLDEIEVEIAEPEHQEAEAEQPEHDQQQEDEPEADEPEEHQNEQDEQHDEHRL